MFGMSDAGSGLVNWLVPGGDPLPIYGPAHADYQWAYTGGKMLVEGAVIEAAIMATAAEVFRFSRLVSTSGTINKLDDVAGVTDDLARIRTVTDDLGGLQGYAESWSDVAVIGKTGSYEQATRALGAHSFQMSDEAWAALSRSQQWEANRMFLDDMIQRRAPFRLASSPLDPENLTGFYLEELRYLTKMGYELSPDGLWMLPTKVGW